MWIARDLNNALYLYTRKPIRDRSSGVFSEDEFCAINREFFPEVTWENSPQKITVGSF